MKGSINVVIQNRKTKYEFFVRRNITIVKGNSATGKTTLIEMVRDYNMLGKESGVRISCDKKCAVIEGIDWKDQLSKFKQTIVFIDEGNRFVSSTDFAKTIQNTDNYYVIVTRESLAALPYSVNEIYGIRMGGKYAGLKPAYNELYHIYSDNNIMQNIKPQIILTEDSNSGYQFFKSVVEDTTIKCVNSAGKSNIALEIFKYNDKNVLIIADGAAFGSEMEKVVKLLNNKPNIFLYLPESFEFLVLSSGCIEDKAVSEMSNNWGEYIESSKYFSWEQFFYDLLVEKTCNTYLEYSKKTINPSYLRFDVKGKILSRMENIELK